MRAYQVLFALAVLGFCTAPNCLGSSDVLGWGYNSFGQLGNGTTTSSAAPTATSGISGVMQIVAGDNHAVALLSDFTVRAWGDHHRGQCGDGTGSYGPLDIFNFSKRTSPVKVVNLSEITMVAAGHDMCAAVRGDGTVWTWGSNEQLQLGYSTGNAMATATPTQVTGLPFVLAVSTSGLHTVALQSDGTLSAWGSNSTGQLGTGDFVTSITPVPVVGITNVTMIAAGGSFTVALRDDGTVWTWGSNGVGELGRTDAPHDPKPAPIVGLKNIIAIAAGFDHAMALKNDHTVVAWGNNASGQLGISPTLTNNPTPSSSVPVPVPGLTNVISISAGPNASAAIRPGGTLWTWGLNDMGQLGRATPFLADSTPKQVVGITARIQAALGDGFMLVR